METTLKKACMTQESCCFFDFQYCKNIENKGGSDIVSMKMQFAIRKAMKSAEPEAIAFGKAVAPDGKEPPIEKVIAMIALNVNNRMYN